MKYQASRYFSPKEIKALLGVDSKDLFYWSRTWGFLRPDKRGSGRGSKNLYSFLGLVKIAVIQELVSYGMTSPYIEHVFKLLNEPQSELVAKTPINESEPTQYQSKKKPSVWALIKKEPTRIKEQGALIFFDNLTARRDKEPSGILLTSDSAYFQLGEDFFQPEAAGSTIHYKSTLIINLGEIIRFIEDKTGVTL